MINSIYLDSSHHTPKRLRPERTRTLCSRRPRFSGIACQVLSAHPALPGSAPQLLLGGFEIDSKVLLDVLEVFLPGADISASLGAKSLVEHQGRLDYRLLLLLELLQGLVDMDDELSAGQAGRLV